MHRFIRIQNNIINTMIKIRPIGIVDIDIVFDHACLLANNSGTKSPDFVLTRERLYEELFGSKASWHGLLAIKNQKVIGSCLYGFADTNRPFNKTACLFLDILFIEPNYRKKGVGQLLMDELTKIAQNKKLSRIEFWCMKNNIAANEFYRKIGAKEVDTLNVYNLDINQL